MIDRLEISGHSPRLPNCRQNHRELRPSDLRVILKNIALAFDYFSEVWLYRLLVLCRLNRLHLEG